VNRLPGRKVPQLRQTIGCVFQDFRLLQQKSVYDNVAFALEVIGKRESNIHKVVPEVLDMVGLSGKAQRLPHELSGGEQQRVAIARAFVNRPLLLLADEPTGNLDPDTPGGTMLLLDKINRTGTTAVMAAHDHEIVGSTRSSARCAAGGGGCTGASACETRRASSTARAGSRGSACALRPAQRSAAEARSRAPHRTRFRRHRSIHWPCLRPLDRRTPRP